MMRIAKSTGIALAAAAALLVLLGATYLSGQKRPPDPYRFQVLCQSDTSTGIPSPYHLILYLDLNSCLSCTEDMDAWRGLCAELRRRGASISVYSPRSDSADVAWAMHLEKISDTTRVLEQDLMSSFNWQRLGTPVKILLDQDGRLLKIAGRMGGHQPSREFIEQLKDVVCGTSRMASATE